MLMCQWVQNRIPAYLSGELGARQAKWLAWHVGQCHVCRKALEVLKGMQAVVTQALATEVRAPDSLNARVMAAIESLPPSHAPPDAPSPRRGFRLWPWRRP